jgi:site-specific DNA recombinase
MLIAGGYARVSTEKQAEDGVSYEEMHRLIEERIAFRGWGLHKIFKDVISGSRFDRRDWIELIASLDQIDVLVVWDIDRIGREFVEKVALIGKLREAGVALEVINGEVDLDTREGKALFGMRAVFAEFERDTVIGRTRMAAGAIAREGRYNGPAPQGYTFVEKLLVPLPAELPVLARIEAEFLGGQTISAICRGLNADNVPTKRGGKWRTATVRSILENPVYIGKVRFRGQLLDGNHEAVRTEEQHTAIQDLLGAGRKRPGRGVGRKPKGPHLFVGGLLRCGDCGESMVPRTAVDVRAIPDTYLCAGKQIAGCKMPMVYRRDIDQAALAYFEQVGLDLDATRETVAEHRDRKLAEIRELLHQAGIQERRAEDRLARIRQDYIDGELSASDWRALRADLEEELAAAAAETERLRGQEADVAAWADLSDAEQVVLEQLTEIRRIVAGRITAAEAIAPLRAALAGAFEKFVLHRADSPAAPRRLSAELKMVGESGCVIEPVARDRAVAGYSEAMQPIFHRLPLQQAENNQRQGIGYRLIDG